MKVHATFDEVARLANQAASAPAGWTSLIDYLARRVDHRVLRSLKTIDIDVDVQAVRTQLITVMSAEPPPAALRAVYFAVVDEVDENERPRIGYYVTGFDRFERDDPDALSRPSWTPARGQLRSLALRSIKQAELAARSLDGMTLLGYTAPLGTAMLLSRFASRGLFPHCQRVVGLDSGGLAEITPE